MEVVRIFPTESELSEIITNIKCTEPNCTSVFPNSSNLEMHLIKTHSKESDFLNERKPNCVFQYFCPVKFCKYYLNEDCSVNQLRWFTKQKYLKQHYMRVHKERSFECDRCGKCFLTGKERNDHTETECGNKFSCISCNAMYNTSVGLWAHCKRKNHLHITSKPAKIPIISSKVNVCIIRKPEVVVQKNSKRRNVMQKEVPILPKPTSNPIENIAAAALSELSWKIVVRGVDKEVQTIGRRKTSIRSLKKRDSQETQTGEKRPKISQETQTSTYKNRSCGSVRLGTETQTLRELFPELEAAPHSLLFSASTQTVPEQDEDENRRSGTLQELFPELEGAPPSLLYSASTQTGEEDSLTGLDLKLFDPSQAEQSLDDHFHRLIQSSLFVESRSCTIQTQTEMEVELGGPLLSNTETQTNNVLPTSPNFDEYSHNYTQTCDDIFLNDFVEFTDIETQTAWASLTVDPALVSAQTQTHY